MKNQYKYLLFGLLSMTLASCSMNGSAAYLKGGYDGNYHYYAPAVSNNDSFYSQEEAPSDTQENSFVKITEETKTSNVSLTVDATSATKIS